MAFAILTEDQLLLLTDEQRIQYEKQLEFYKKRSDFVEQMEKYESIHLEPFQPKLKPIAVQYASEVQSVQIKPYEVQPQQKVAVPELPDLPDSVSAHSIAALPVIAATSVDVASPKFEKNQPVVPKIAQPTVNHIHCLMPTVSKIKLPEMRPGISAPKVAFSPIDAANVVLPTLAQEVYTSMLPKKPFDSPRFSLPSLPGIAVPEKKWQSFHMKAPEITELSKASVDELLIPFVHIPAPHKPVLPQLTPAPHAAHAYTPPAMDCVTLPQIAVQPLQATYAKPTLHPPVLPQQPQATLSFKPISMKSFAVSALPPKKETVLPKSNYKPFPEVQSKLPQIKTPARFEKSETMPKPHSANLPKIQTPSVHANLKSIPAVSVCVNAPSAGTLNLKLIHMPSAKVLQLPKLVDVDSAALYQQILEMQPKQIQEDQ